jgi:hypothetical protein
VGADLVDGDKQRDFAKGYVTAFLSLVDGKDEAARSYFLEPPALLRPLGVDPSLKMHQQARLQTGVAKAVMDDYETDVSTSVSSSGQAVSGTVSGATVAYLLDGNLGDESEVYNRFFQETKGVLFNWIASTVYTESLDPAQQDLREAKAICFRVAQQPKNPLTLALNGPMRLSVELEDASSRVSAVSTAMLDEIPGIYPATVGSADTTSAAFKTFRFPTAAFTAVGRSLDLAHITKVRIKLGGPGDSPQGRVAVDDLEVEK